MIIRSNLAISVDGKIATPSREFYALGTPEDRRQMQVIRRLSDVVIFGASSLRTYRKPCTVGGAAAQWASSRARRAIRAGDSSAVATCAASKRARSVESPPPPSSTSKSNWAPACR